MMSALVEANPEYAWSIRLELVEMKILPDVITRITAVYCQDEVCIEKENMYYSFTYALQDKLFQQHLSASGILVLGSIGC